MTSTATRERRSTAGNRLQALLAREFEAEEGFVEVENDEDFVAKDGAMPGVPTRLPAACEN